MASAVDRLTLACGCGQTMIVPASAMYRNGLCPHCGAEVHITPENTRATEDQDRPRAPGSGLLRRQWQASGKSAARADTTTREEAARRFASAVDLYNGKRFAEALTVLDALLRDFPGDPHVLAAREECMNALHAPRALPYLAGGVEVTEEPEQLSYALVEAVLLDRLLNGEDGVQVAAARAALEFLRGKEFPHPREEMPENTPSSGVLPSVDARIREAAVEAVSDALGALRGEFQRWAGELVEAIHASGAGVPEKKTASSRTRKGAVAKKQSKPRTSARKKTATNGRSKSKVSQASPEEEN